MSHASMHHLIPKIFHFVWIGDENKRPNACIDSWKEKNPDFEIKVWGNEELYNVNWLFKDQIAKIMESGQIYGAADLMRWEILYNHGGITLDADSLCISAIPEWLLTCTAFACWQNEFSRPGLISNGYVGAHKRDPLIHEVIQRLAKEEDLAYKKSWFGLKVKRRSSWKTTGPQILTNCYFDLKYSALTVLPSHFFIPEDQKGNKYNGGGPVYSKQLFGSTRNGHVSYDEISGLCEKRILEKLNK